MHGWECPHPWEGGRGDALTPFNPSSHSFARSLFKLNLPNPLEAADPSGPAAAVSCGAERPRPDPTRPDQSFVPSYCAPRGKRQFDTRVLYDPAPEPPSPAHIATQPAINGHAHTHALCTVLCLCSIRVEWNGMAWQIKHARSHIG